MSSAKGLQDYQTDQLSLFEIEEEQPVLPTDRDACNQNTDTALRLVE